MPRLLALALVILAAGPAAADPRDEKYTLRVLLPLYLFPDPDPNSAAYRAWQQVIDAPKGVSVVAIINPASGPTDPKDPAGEPARRRSYSELLDRGKANPELGFVGYITLSDNKSERRGGRPEWIVRDAAAIERDVDLWYEVYGKGRANFLGIFFDLHPAFDKDELDKVNAAVRHVLKRDPKALIFRNLGRVSDSPAVLLPPGGAEDVACLWEHDAKVHPFDEFARPAWAQKLPPKRFAALVYNQPELKFVSTAVEKKVGWLCVSDKSGAWPGLPAYWKEFAAAVAAANAGK